MREKNNNTTRALIFREGFLEEVRLQASLECLGYYGLVKTRREHLGMR